MWAQEKLWEKFHTHKDTGLTTDQANTLFKQLGENALTEKATTPWYVLLLKEFTGFFALLLWFGGILCFIGYAMDPSSEDNLFLGIVLCVVVLVTGIFSYQQTSKAASLMADFKNFIPKEALVMRDGSWKKIEARLLVPGDIIRLNGGDNIPADCILFNANEMKVNNASLTGESEDLLRVVDSRASNIFESPNVAFFGTMCTAGTGDGMVFKTGDGTVIGRIAGLATSADSAQTTLSREIERFIMFISIVAITLGIIFFILGLIIGYPIITDVIFAIGIIVANVPEGLLVTVTVALALTAKRMAKKFVLVKNLEAVETLGSTSCICSDKTGTLTQNRMTVSQLFFNGSICDAGVNWEIFKRLEEIETKKGADGNLKGLQQPQYDNKDGVFRVLVETIALATVSFFAYEPTSEDIRQLVSKKKKVSIKKLPKDVSKDTDPKLFEEYQSATTELIERECAKPYIKRNVEGDASETGLLKFIQPLLMAGPYGAFGVGGIDGLRKTHPTVVGIDDCPALIPFSSDIKFNLIIRDMNIAVTQPQRAEDNMYVFLKGAPERVVNRCSTMLTSGDGDEIPLSAEVETQIDLANKRFGGNGERVLAFARLKLDHIRFNKANGDQKPYPFDVKRWKSWKEVREFDAGINGWFPMWNLQLVGLVSLNDPPRPSVDISVLKCRHAGIRVIMVTGDQPPTAAAIAHKVNIISDPDLEYNKILELNPGMSENEAFAKCRAIVIHGDELAKVHAAEEALDDNEIEKGRKIMDWIRKPEVVFARTTPS